MATQYKPTKSQKASKPLKAEKAPKADKAVKFSSSVQTVKTSKPAKPPKQPKAPKPEKSAAFKPGKVEKSAKYEHSSKSSSGVMTKAVNPKIVLAVIAALIVVAVVVIVVAVPAAEKHGEEIRNIMISSTPDKTVYLVGDEPNYEGLRVLVTKNNGETFTVRETRCQLTGFDSSAPADSQTITVTYEGFTASFSIRVEEPPKLTPALMGITLETLPKTEYKLGEWLDTTGGVILCEYVDGSVYRISLENNDVFGDVDFNTPGTYTLTVRYMENGIIAETTYTITVE